ncbi:MAG: hypothetical protein PHP54_02550 [Clostridia bacterium]|nr:hypothetical protein [Clostridia bacterium]
MLTDNQNGQIVNYEYLDNNNKVIITDAKGKAHKNNPEKAAYNFVEIQPNLTKYQARLLEQVVISSLGLAKYGEGRLNRINSISSKREATYGIYEFLQATLGLNVEAGSLYNRIENEMLLKQEEGFN